MQATFCFCSSKDYKWQIFCGIQSISTRHRTKCIMPVAQSKYVSCSRPTTLCTGYTNDSNILSSEHVKNIEDNLLYISCHCSRLFRSSQWRNASACRVQVAAWTSFFRQDMHRRDPHAISNIRCTQRRLQCISARCRAIQFCGLHCLHRL